MYEPEDAGELKSFEARLANLAPRDDRLDRERLMYLMGMAAERSASEPFPSPSLQRRGDMRCWQAAFAAMSAVAATLMCMLVMRPAEDGVSPRLAEQLPLKLQANTVGVNGKDVLAVRDAFSSDIEQRMRHLSEASATTTAPLVQPERPPLTPAGWRRAFDSSTEGSETNSSTAPRTWRAHA